MQNLTTPILVMGLALGSATAQSGWKNLTGKDAPPIHADKWINTGGAGATDLKGKVWLLEFFATW